MTGRTVPTPDGPLTYAEWLQWRITQRAAGVYIACGPDIADAPTFWECIWRYGRPNWQAEKELEHQLTELERQARKEARAEAGAEIA